MTGYELSRMFFDWCYENTSAITPNHIALYFFCIEHNNRLGWKKEFGLPMEMAKEAIGIKNYRTYRKAFDDLVEWGFIKVVKKSKNQYSANVIALVKNTKATTKALSKATQKHSQKQYNSIVGIDKPNNHITLEPNNNAVDFPKGKSLFENCIDDYDNFCKKNIGVGAKIDGAQGKAMKEIIKYLKTQVKEKENLDAGVRGAWCYILENWQSLDNFLTSQVKLTQINSNILQILNELRNGKGNKAANASVVDGLIAEIAK